MTTQNAWVLASNNAGKLKEFQTLLAPLHIQIDPQKEFGVEDAIEDGLSFIENAIIKARHASEKTGRPALADDSGLEVDALKGEPGIYSARYSAMNGGEKSDQANLQLVLEKMKDVPEAERTARFHCVLAFVRHAKDPCPLIIPRAWEGSILFEPRGENGFGYDPIFSPEGESRSFAEMSMDEKNAISHRGRAIKKLVAFLSSL